MLGRLRRILKDVPSSVPLLGVTAVLGLYAVKYFTYYARPPRLTYAPTEFNQALLQHCQILHEAHYPTFWATNGHIATLVGDMLRSQPEMTFRREKVLTPDGGTVNLDHMEDSRFNESTPTIIVLHGLNGGSHSHYVRHLLKLLHTKLGMRCIAVNNRGHNNSELTSPRIVSGAYTDDIRQVINMIHARYPRAPLFLAGFSMGANILTKYLGEEGDKTPIMAAVSISNPLDFNACSRQLEEGVGKGYNSVLTTGLIQTYRRLHHHFKDHPQLEHDVVLAAKTLRQFDDAFTRRVWGYLDDYYNDASSINYLRGVKVPLLVLEAEDDPIIPATAFAPLEQKITSQHVIIAATATGGHIGFPEGILPIGQVRNYADRVAESFLGAILRLAAAGKLSKPSSPAVAPRSEVEVINDAGLKREAAAQVWLWDADKHEMHKEKERVGDEQK